MLFIIQLKYSQHFVYWFCKRKSLRAQLVEHKELSSLRVRPLSLTTPKQFASAMTCKCDASPVTTRDEEEKWTGQKYILYISNKITVVQLFQYNISQ